MKRYPLLLFFFVLAWTAVAQSREEIMAQMNTVKLDTQRYLYGYCTIPEEPDSNVVISEAIKDLAVQIGAYCRQEEYKYVKSLDDIKEEKLSLICCPIYEDCFRAMAYIPKVVLTDLEEQKSSLMESEERSAVIRQITESLVKAQSMDSIFDLVKTHDDMIVSGENFDDSTQKYINEGYLIYYEHKSGKILELMTPPDTNGLRHNVRTGAVADPLRHVTTPYWIFIANVK